MIGELLIVVYVLIAIGVGIQMFFKTVSWLSETDRTVFPVPFYSVLGWGIVAFFTAMVLESLVLRFSREISTAMLALAIVVGPIEEGAKLLPFVVKQDENAMTRWHLTVRTALFFGIIEALMYFVLLISMGNFFGAILRGVVVMFHVAWTAIALEGALRGSLWDGYLKAALLHCLYDAPIMLIYPLGGLAGLIVPVSIAALIYINGAVDDAFGFAVSYARKLVERKREMYAAFEERYEVLRYGDEEMPGVEEPEKENQKEENEDEDPEGFTSLP